MEEQTVTVIATIISLITIVTVFSGFISNQAKLEVQLTNIQKELVIINEKLDKRDVEQIISWSEEANELVGTYTEDLDLSVLKIDFSFEDITDISMSNLYNLIKQDDFFLGSEDIL